MVLHYCIAPAIRTLAGAELGRSLTYLKWREISVWPVATQQGGGAGIATPCTCQARALADTRTHANNTYTALFARNCTANAADGAAIVQAHGSRRPGARAALTVESFLLPLLLPAPQLQHKPKRVLGVNVLDSAERDAHRLTGR